MPTSTYVALATTTLGGTDASVTFSSIPATYRDLVIVIEATTSVDALIQARFNGDTGSNYGYVVMRATSSTGSSSGTYNVAYLMDNLSEATKRFQILMNVQDYSATDKHKPALVRSGTEQNADGNSSVYASAHRWANTSAITSIELFTSAGGFVAGSTFSLYGSNRL